MFKLITRSRSESSLSSCQDSNAHGTALSSDFLRAQSRSLSEKKIDKPIPSNLIKKYELLNTSKDWQGVALRDYSTNIPLTEMYEAELLVGANCKFILGYKTVEVLSGSLTVSRDDQSQKQCFEKGKFFVISHDDDCVVANKESLLRVCVIDRESFSNRTLNGKKQSDKKGGVSTSTCYTMPSISENDTDVSNLFLKNPAEEVSNSLVSVKRIFSSNCSWNKEPLPPYPKNDSAVIQVLKINVPSLVPSHYHPVINVAIMEKGALLITSSTGKKSIFFERQVFNELVGSEGVHKGASVGIESACVVVQYVMSLNNQIAAHSVEN